MPERDSTTPEKMGSRCLEMLWDSQFESNSSDISHLFHVDVVTT